MSTVLVILAIVLASFVSEDLTCIATGLEIHRGDVDPWVGLIGCTVGIYVGDLLLWGVARTAGRAVLRWPFFAKRMSRRSVRKMGHWIDRNLPAAVISSRFVPGTRLPMFVAVGLLGRRSGTFLFWTLVAAILWTPTLVLLVAWQGERIVGPAKKFLGGGWLALVAAAIVLVFALKLVAMALTGAGRRTLSIKVSKLWRWEFWPAWVFYAPLVPFVAGLMARYGAFETITAANPGIPHGGFVGESKSQILSNLDPTHIIPYTLVGPGPLVERVAGLERTMVERGWTFPLILKPDAGQRGTGLKLARSIADVRAYLRRYPLPVVAQVYDPGPFEAGIFYYRIPGEPTGHIYSITDKEFPVVTGDGVSTLETLIWNHPRHRMQAATFLKRHEKQVDLVLPAGQPMRLGVAGNHCQGTMFLDGSRLITPKLTSLIDQVSQSFDGFFIGRFDVRYSNPEAFKNGEDLHIIELNGITSESTNLYDPSFSLFRAYGILFEQWRLLFRIGDANRKRGARVSTLWELHAAYREFFDHQKADSLAD